MDSESYLRWFVFQFDNHLVRASIFDYNKDLKSATTMGFNLQFAFAFTLSS